eukprot:scaffold100581_cov66-Phaeocystis_antarctica.AAC.4
MFALGRLDLQARGGSPAVSRLRSIALSGEASSRARSRKSTSRPSGLTLACATFALPPSSQAEAAATSVTGGGGEGPGDGGGHGAGGGGGDLGRGEGGGGGAGGRSLWHTTLGTPSTAVLGDQANSGHRIGSELNCAYHLDVDRILERDLLAPKRDSEFLPIVPKVQLDLNDGALAPRARDHVLWAHDAVLSVWWRGRWPRAPAARNDWRDVVRVLPEDLEGVGLRLQRRRSQLDADHFAVVCILLHVCLVHVLDLNGITPPEDDPRVFLPFCHLHVEGEAPHAILLDPTAGRLDRGAGQHRRWQLIKVSRSGIWKPLRGYPGALRYGRNLSAERSDDDDSERARAAHG